MKFKKTLAMLLATVSLLGLAAGCGEDKEKTKEDNGEAVEVSSEKNKGGKKNAEKEETVTLTWYIPGATLTDKEAVQAKINEIVEPAIGRKVRLETIDSSAYGEQMGLMLSAGDDTFDLYFSGYTIGYDKMVNDEVLAPMTDLINNNAPELWDAIPDYVWEDMKVDGEIYSVPNVLIMATQYSYGIQTPIFDEFIASNPEVAAELGWEIGKTNRIEEPEDLEPLLAWVKQNKPDMYAYRPNYGTTMWTGTKYEDIGGGMVVEKGSDSREAIVLARTPEYKQAAETLRSWYEKGYIRADVATVRDDDAEFKAGKYAVSQMTWKPSTSEQYPPDEWTFVLIGDAFVPRGAAKPTCTGINYMSNNKEEAIKLLALVQTNEELYNLLTLGIEGEHYDLNRDGTYTPIDNSGYSVTQWMVGNQFNALVKEGSDPDVWKDTEAMNNNALKTKLLGFTFDYTKVENEIRAISADGEIYTAHMNKGTKPVSEYWDEYMTVLNNKGIDKIRVEVQRQLDEFWENKN